MLFLFALTLSLSAALLFLVQPMFAKMLMPQLGGTPAIWNTSIVFFQLALVGGYLYSHVTRRMSLRRLAWTHATVLLLPLLVLPVQIRNLVPVAPDRHPFAWLCLVLTVSVGLPFFALATSAPILQRWFGSTTHWSARDPYFLYAASNGGSLFALLAYPLLVEPGLSLSTQRRLWAIGYGVFVLLTLVCASFVRRSAGATSHVTGATSTVRANAISWSTRLRWLALAAVPSSLMLSTNTLITTDIAAVPLLWVVPLAIYLLTFVLVFARREILPHHALAAILPLAIIPSVLAVVRDTMPAPSIIPVHLLTLFIAAMVCHGELARTRPSSAHLTDFYLWMSAGGALGGLFNTLVAPLLFTTAAEYPLGLVLACLVRPTRPVADSEAETTTEPPSRKGRVHRLAVRCERRGAGGTAGMASGHGG